MDGEIDVRNEMPKSLLMLMISRECGFHNRYNVIACKDYVMVRPYILAQSRYTFTVFVITVQFSGRQTHNKAYSTRRLRLQTCLYNIPVAYQWRQTQWSSTYSVGC